MTNIYVQDIDGRPLMPCHSSGRAKRMLRSGKAVIVNTMPFTIRLTYRIDDPVCDECLLGIDPGRTNIGLCAIDSKGRVLYASDIVTRNKTIASLMLARKRARQVSRRGERKRRQRRAIASDSTGMEKATEFWRQLPGCEKPVCCKVMRNTPAKFSNRKRKDGWLTPTATQLLKTHVNAVRLVEKILPVSGIVVEINRFDFAKMDDPGIRNWEYQKGRLFGYRDVYEAVSSAQEGECLLCGKRQIDHYHHLVPRGKGSETIDNLAGLCTACHERIHTDEQAEARLKSKKQGLLKRYGALSVINQIMEPLLKSFSIMHPTYVTTGYETKALRKLYGIEKEHHADAWCIAVSALEAQPDVKPCLDGAYEVVQFRRHDRALIKSQRERTYKLNGVTAAKNRRKRMDQKEDSLHEWYLKAKQQYGETEARRIQSKLSVTKSRRFYNDTSRVMPGAVFTHNGKRYVMSGQITNGKYYRAVGDAKTNHPARDCRIVRQNTGLVYIDRKKTA